jgi:membrane peptidoglycan carboxypeptidase
MGYENKTVETTRVLEDIKGVHRVTGGTHPARLWQQFMRVALEGVPVTEFSEPAPIEAVPDAAQVRARRGFAPGGRMYPTGPPAREGYVEDLGAPEADLPTTTTSTTEPPTTTTEPTTTTTEGGLFG